RTEPRLVLKPSPSRSERRRRTTPGTRAAAHNTRPRRYGSSSIACFALEIYSLIYGSQRRLRRPALEGQQHRKGAYHVAAHGRTPEAHLVGCDSSIGRNGADALRQLLELR